jgi:2-dehydropantoate 2-reductase
MIDMNITILGCGAIGAMVASFLQEGNVEQKNSIQIVGRQHVIEPIQKNGLIYVPFNESNQEKWLKTKNFQTFESMHSVPRTDVLILTSKAHSLEQNLAAIKEKLEKEQPITIILMNGLGLRDIVQKYIPENKIIEAIANYPVHLVGNIVTNDGGNDEIVADNSPASNQYFPELFGKSHLKWRIDPNFRTGQWKKAIMNIGMNGMAALTKLKVGEVLARDTLMAVINEMIRETINLAQKEQISGLEYNSMVEFFVKFAGRDPDHYPSMYFDIINHKPTEIDFMNGYIVRKSEYYGLQAPANAALHTLMKIAENRVLLQQKNLSKYYI